VPQQGITLSGYLAVMDELTTLAVVAHPRSACRPGVSTSFYVELCSAEGIEAAPGQQIDIISSVIKMGKTFAFTSAQAIDANTGKIICIGRHTKYLPGGFVQDLILRNGWLMTLAPASSMHESDTLEPLDLEKSIINNSFFVHHKFRNGNGSLHGGCAAMIMAQVASQTQQPNRVLQSMYVSYASPGRDNIEIETNHLNTHSSNVILKSSKGQLIADGILNWIPISKY